ncbi:MAG: PEP-CTERM sorting domain-containing protein [Roseateles sp.]|uniref:PEP-CTERM sorting domain-containing protein n=1 Tax=Roseateles sp. TaxID=1971397 RepID=UPI0039E88E49
MKTLILATALASAFAAPAPSRADELQGTTVEVRYDYVGGGQDWHTSDSVMVSDDIELSCPGAAQLCNVLTVPTQTLDIDDRRIRYHYTGTGLNADFSDIAVNAFTFASLYGSDRRIAGVALETTIDKLDLSRLSFADHSIRIDMRGLSAAPDAWFEIYAWTAPVPEPASAALLLGGLALLAAQRRRAGRR